MDTSAERRHLSATRKVPAETRGLGPLGHRVEILRGSDMDRLREPIRGTETEITLLEPGESRYETHEFHLGDATINTGWFGPGVLARGGWPPDQATLGFVVDAPGPAVVNGHVARPHAVQLYAGDSETDYRAPPGTMWMVYTTGRERLDEAMCAVAGRPLPFPKTGVLNLQASPAEGQALASWLNALLASPQQEVSGEAGRAWAQRIESHLHRLLRNIFGGARSPGSPSVRAAKRERIARKAEAYARTHPNARFSLSDLAQAVGVPERTLQHHFSTLYGISPRAWLRNMKLNRARRELVRRRPCAGAVTRVAHDLGLTHLGRFSREYRRLFGETPRQTLLR